MSLADSKALAEELKKLWEANKKLLALAESENRSFTPEEEQEWDKRDKDIDELDKRIGRVQKLEKEMRERQSIGDPDDRGKDPKETADKPTEARMRSALRNWGLGLTEPDDLRILKPFMSSASDLQINLSTDYRQVRKNFAKRAQSTTDAAGGFTIPEGFSGAIETAMLQFGGMRQARTTVMRTASGNDLPWPTVNDTSNTGELLAENTAAAEQDVTFGVVTLQAFKYSSKLIKVSIELMQDSAFDLAQYLGERLGERIGRITNTHFTTGTGTGQPNGIVTASAVGKTGAVGQTTTVTYADLVDLQHSVDPAYRANAEWMFSDNSLAIIKKLVDGNSVPLWAPNIIAGEPSTILGNPYVVNQDVADMAANAKSILFGDFSKYVIRDVLGITLRRLDERYAELAQVAFVAFSRHDGDEIDAGTVPVKHYANSAT